MTTAYVLMTAMPPTIGHLSLMQFAAEVADRAVVIVTTQPGEPMPLQRYLAVSEAAPANVSVKNLHRLLPQDPASEGFWPMWKQIMTDYGMTSDDFMVTSEPYGQTLAELMDATFIPYDIDRVLVNAKATKVRNFPRKNYGLVMPTFKQYFHKTITVFGAESVGKTHTSKHLADALDGTFLPEWARPYLETVGSEVTVEKMHAIWRGQKALQIHARKHNVTPFIIQDTDLFSTLGYWRMYSPDTVPDELVQDCIDLKSDLYIIMSSNIEFEPDELRYGGDHRESNDQYWGALLAEFSLQYSFVDSPSYYERDSRAVNYANSHVGNKFDKMVKYDRGGF